LSSRRPQEKGAVWRFFLFEGNLITQPHFPTGKKMEIGQWLFTLHLLPAGFQGFGVHIAIARIARRCPVRFVFRIRVTRPENYF